MYTTPMYVSIHTGIPSPMYVSIHTCAHIPHECIYTHIHTISYVYIYTHIHKTKTKAFSSMAGGPEPVSVLYPFLLCFQNKCVPYWPEVGTQRVYGLYSVTNCKEHDTTEYKLRTLQISPLDNVSIPVLAHCRSLSLICFLVWVGGTRIFCGSSKHLTLCPWPRGTWFGRYGITSTSAGLTMGFLVSLAVSLASWIRSTSDRKDCLMRGPSLCIAGESLSRGGG